MRDFIVSHRRLLAWSLVVVVPLLLALLETGSLQKSIPITLTALACAIIPATVIFSAGLFTFQIAKTVVDVGHDASAFVTQRKRKLHSDYEWGATAQLPAHDSSSYAIGDDGELIETADTDEKPKHDASAL